MPISQVQTNGGPEEYQGISQREFESEVYMACIMQGRRLGVAYYDARTPRDVCAGNLGGWQSRMPISAAPYNLLSFIQAQKWTTALSQCFKIKVANSITEDCEGYEVKLVKSSIFCYQQAWHRLAYLRVSGMQEDLTDSERMHLLNSMMSLDSEMQVRAAGGLLAILQVEMLIGTMDKNKKKMVPVQIESVSELSLNGFLNIDAATHHALQIFQVEKHASSMGIGKEKEGFSVFGLLNKCVTLMGRKLLRQWFLRPILDLTVLNDRLDTISFFKSSQDLVSALQDSLKSIKDIPNLLKKFSCPRSASVAKDWLMFTKSISALIHIRAIFEITASQQRQSQVSLFGLQIVDKIKQLDPIIRTVFKAIKNVCNRNANQAAELYRYENVFSAVNEDLIYVKDLVTGVIDFDQTCGERCETMVVYGLCEQLDELKNIYEGLPDFLHQVASVELNRLPRQEIRCAQGSIVYIPQIGYLMRFGGKKLQQDVLDHLPDFEFAFEGGIEGVFYHTLKTRELDEVVGDVYHRILDMEQALLRDLEKRVIAYASSLQQAANVAAEIDCLIALSIVAHDQKYMRPQLTEKNVLIIKNGRHPLQECVVNTFVPNDTDIGQKDRVSVITGPNYSGKSIYVKQVIEDLKCFSVRSTVTFELSSIVIHDGTVALIVFLAHIGSFVPAETATIGLTDRIFTRIVSKDTMAVPRSTFMIDLHQIAVMLRHATPRSLCIIDEFGQGTLSTDGIGLLCATLKHFAFCTSPAKVLACTHFSEVFDEAYLPKSENIVFRTMDILEPDKTLEVSDRLNDIIFLYRLVPGRAVSSYGMHCAELADVPAEILDRAAKILELIIAAKPFERLDSQRTAAKDQLYKTLAEKLLGFDCEKGDVSAILTEIFSLCKSDPQR